MQASVACVCSLRIYRSLPPPFLLLLPQRFERSLPSSRRVEPQSQSQSKASTCRDEDMAARVPTQFASSLLSSQLPTARSATFTSWSLHRQHQPSDSTPLYAETVHRSWQICLFFFFLFVFAINLPTDTRCTPPTSAMRPPSDEGPDQHLNMPVLLSVEYTSCRLTKLNHVRCARVVRMREFTAVKFAV